MKKKICIAILALTLSGAVLSGCGSKEAEETNEVNELTTDMDARELDADMQERMIKDATDDAPVDTDATEESAE